MTKEKRSKESTGEKKAKKRKLPGTESLAPPVDAPDSEAPVKIAKDTKVGKPIYKSPIASPLADEKLKKKALKLVTAATTAKLLKRGVKEVVKVLKKQTTGVCLIAGDIFPVDVIAHLPIMCEDRNIPYVYVPSKEELGASGMTNRPSSCMLILREPLKGELSGDALKEYQDLYDQVNKRMKAVQITY